MRPHAIIKEQMGHRHIGNIGLHITPAIGGHLKTAGSPLSAPSRPRHRGGKLHRMFSSRRTFPRLTRLAHI